MAQTKILDWQAPEGSTVGATTVDLLTIAVPANSNLSVKARVQLYEGTPAGGSIEINGSFTRGGGAPVADAAAVSLSSLLNAVLATVGLAFVISGNSVILRGTGIVAKTINWFADGRINIYTP